MIIPIVRSSSELGALVASWKAEGNKAGLVPTMGALHEGHLSLVREAKLASDKVIVTIFVNPKQFNNPSDLKSYPRTEESDAEKLAPFGVDAVYAPDVSQIYPDGFSTNISVSGVSEGLCGAHRPGHFDGVATVVAKLFLQSKADCAFFGEKDYQQLQVVKKMVRDLDLGVDVIGCPTIRDSDGLALSSRNTLLSEKDRSRAKAIHCALKRAAEKLENGGKIKEALPLAVGEILAAGFQEVEYLELREIEGFTVVEDLAAPSRLLVAARIGDVRLIDNIAVG